MKNAVTRIGGFGAFIGGALALSAVLVAAPAIAEDVKDIEIPVQKVDPAAKPAAPAAAPAAKAPAAAPAAKPAPAAAAPAAKPAPAAAAPAAKPAPAAAAAPAADKAAPAAAPAAAAAAPAGDGKTAADSGKWIKLCDKIPVLKKDKDGKESKEEKNFCVSQIETLDGNTGRTIASIGIQNFEGEEKQLLSALVPVGMVIPQGVNIAMLTKEQVEAAKEKDSKLDPKSVKQVELKFSHCLEIGCFAEAPATPEIIADIKAASSLMVSGLHITRRSFVHRLPVANFAEALAGPPVDNKQYTDARKQVMMQIAERRKEMDEKYKEEMEKRGDAMKNLPGANTTGAAAAGAPATTGSTAQPAAKAPEKK